MTLISQEKIVQSQKNHGLATQNMFSLKECRDVIERKFCYLAVLGLRITLQCFGEKLYDSFQNASGNESNNAPGLH